MKMCDTVNPTQFEILIDTSKCLLNNNLVVESVIMEYELFPNNKISELELNE